MMGLLAILACDGGAGSAGAVDTTELWVASDGRFQVYRYLEADASDAGLDTATPTEELLQARFGEGGCTGSGGWRVELRVGQQWETSTESGALHFDDAEGLSLCGFEEAGGSLVAPDPIVTLWSGDNLQDGDTVTSGSWEVTLAREQDLVTYFGVFPNSVAFSLKGPDVGPAGWVLHLAPKMGIVLIEAPTFMADLVYVR